MGVKNLENEIKLKNPCVRGFKINYGGTPKVVLAANVRHQKLLGPKGQEKIRDVNRQYEFHDVKALVDILANEAKMDLDEIIWGLFVFINWLKMNPEYLKEAGGKYELGVVAAEIIIETERDHPKIYEWDDFRDSLEPFANWSKNTKKWVVVGPESYETEYPEDPILKEVKTFMCAYNAVAFAMKHVPGIDYDDPSIDIGDIYNAQIAAGELGNFLLTGKMGIFDDLSSKD